MNRCLKVLQKILPYRLYKYLKRFEIDLNDYPYREYTKKHECIFIHVPKVAGTSVLNCLMGDDIYRDHATHFEYKVADPGKFNRYFKFAFVRNPWDRAVSTYEYLKSGGNKKEDLYFYYLIKDKYPTFDEFVLNYLDKDSIFGHVLFKPQYQFLYDFSDKCLVDFIGRFEQLEDDFLVVSERLNLNAKLPKVNAIARDDYRNYYTNKKVIERISFLYKKDMELFNYRFNEPI